VTEVSKVSGSSIEEIQPTGGAYPEVSPLVFVNEGNRIVRDREWIVGIVFEVNASPCLPIESVEPFGADPEGSASVFIDGANTISGHRRRIARIVTVPLEIVFGPIIAIETSLIRSNPDISRMIFIQGKDLIGKEG
jgi:hypothetical protein